MAAAVAAITVLPNKADPAPITEANLLEQSTLQNIREYQHKDVNGNYICKKPIVRCTASS